MKKNNLIYIVLFVFMFSCKDNQTEYLFKEPVNQRTKSFKNKYINTLTSPDNGWIGYYTPNGKRGTNVLLLNFDKKGNVVMKSDYLNGQKDGTITYRIDKTLKMELVFETNSVLHAIYEENNNNSGGEYVFNILEATPEKVILESKNDNGYNNEKITILELRPAKSNDWNGFAPIIQMNKNINESATVWRYITVDNKVIANFRYKQRSKVAVINYIDKNGKHKLINAPIAIKDNGFCFIDKLDIKGNKLKCFSWNKEKKVFENSINKSKINHENKPILSIPSYDFGKEAGNIRIIRTNNGTIGLDNSSEAFIKFFEAWKNNFKKAIGLPITRVYIRAIDKKTSYIQIYIPTSKGNAKARFDCTYKISKDSLGNRIVKFSFVSDSPNNIDYNLFSFFKPLTDFFFRDAGFYVQKMTPLNDNQNTIGLVPVDDPTMLVHWYDFN